MKFTTKKEDLVKAISIASHLSTTRATLPILQNLFLEATSSGLLIKATDLEQTLEIEVGGQTDEVGKVTSPSRLLVEYLQNNSDKEITLESEDTSLTVKSLNHSASIKGLPAEEYPTIPKVKADHSFSLDSSNLARAIELTLFASASDDSRPILNSLLWRFRDHKLTIVGTDGYRLAFYQTSFDHNFEGDYILPKKTMLELVRIINSNELEVIFAASQVVFVSGAVRLTSRILEGSYPAFESIIPQKAKEKVIFNGTLLLQDLRLASLFSRDSAYSTKLHLDKNKLKIISISPQVGESSSEITLETTVGSPLNISLNAQYLIDALVVVGDQITLEFVDEKSPIVLRTPKSDQAEYVYLVMPLRSG